MPSVIGHADDARKFMYEEAERLHLDRCAALSQHLGQHRTTTGNPDAPLARAFVASLDGEPTVVEHHAGIQHIRRVLNGRVVPESSGQTRRVEPLAAT